MSSSCEFYKGFCQLKAGKIHNEKSCHEKMKDYFWGADGWICPYCKSVQKKSYENWYKKHQSHLCPFTTDAKANLAKRLLNKRKKDMYNETQDGDSDFEVNLSPIKPKRVNKMSLKAGGTVHPSVGEPSGINVSVPPAPHPPAVNDASIGEVEVAVGSILTPTEGERDMSNETLEEIRQEIYLTSSEESGDESTSHEKIVEEDERLSASEEEGPSEVLPIVETRPATQKEAPKKTGRKRAERGDATRASKERPVLEAGCSNPTKPIKKPSKRWLTKSMQRAIKQQSAPLGPWKGNLETTVRPRLTKDAAVETENLITEPAVRSDDLSTVIALLCDLKKEIGELKADHIKARGEDADKIKRLEEEVKASREETTKAREEIGELRAEIAKKRRVVTTDYF